MFCKPLLGLALKVCLTCERPMGRRGRATLRPSLVCTLPEGKEGGRGRVNVLYLFVWSGVSGGSVPQSGTDIATPRSEDWWR